jgi:hypothetical protein
MKPEESLDIFFKANPEMEPRSNSGSHAEPEARDGRSQP